MPIDTLRTLLIVGIVAGMSRESAIRRRDIVTYLEDRGIKIPSLAVILPAVGIVISELSMYYGRLDYALWGHAITLLFCVFAPLLAIGN